MSETQLVKSCQQLLDLKKIFNYRNNTGAFKTDSGHFYKFGFKGSPDIVAVINGRYIGIECKVPKGKQSDAQKEFESNLKKAGGDYWLIRDIDELLLKIG